MKIITLLSAAAVAVAPMPVLTAPAAAHGDHYRYDHRHHVRYRTVCRTVRVHHHWERRCHRVRVYR